MTGSFSSIYMSRNRVRSWQEPSYTIQAGGRHAPIHPDAPKMIKVGKDKMKFDSKSKSRSIITESLKSSKPTETDTDAGTMLDENNIL